MSAKAAAGLRPVEQVTDGAEAVGHEDVTALADQQDGRIAERGAALRAGVDGDLGQLAVRGLPVRAADRPRHDVLEPAEDGPACTGRLQRPDPLARPDGAAAPGACAAAAHASASPGSSKRRSPAATTSGSPSRAAIVSGTLGSRVGKSTDATLRPPNAAASASTPRARLETSPSGASSSPLSTSIATAVAGAGRNSGSGWGAAPGGACAAIANVSSRSDTASEPSGPHSTIVAARSVPLSSSSTTRSAPDAAMNARTVATASAR